MGDDNSINRSEKQFVLMVRPSSFGTNMETVSDNHFMKDIINDAQDQALTEFQAMVENLKCKNVNLLVFDQVSNEAKDSIFPNNWFSTHLGKNFPRGLLIIYPLKSPNRRLERNKSIIEYLVQLNIYHEFLDLSSYELSGEFLESTGSLIFDDDNNTIYCSKSERATEKMLDIYIKKFNEISKNPYNLVIFSAQDSSGNQIYHTNVVMSVLTKHILICLDAIVNIDEREYIKKYLENSNKKIIEISLQEMTNFCGNVISIKDPNFVKDVLILSKRAFTNYKKEILEELTQFYDLCISDIPTIENVGGGSCRCMVAQIFA